MSKNKSKSKSKSKSKVNKVNAIRGRGRPAYQTKWPIGKFTLTDLMVLNGVNPQTGKGKFCSKLTLIKSLERDRLLKNNSFIVKTDETKKPISESGLGRKCFVYVRRSKLNKSKVNADVTVPIVDINTTVEVPVTQVETPIVETPIVEVQDNELVAS